LKYVVDMACSRVARGGAFPPAEDMILHAALGIIARRATEGQLTQAARPAFLIIIVADASFEELGS
jgi:hypothetical protein